MPTTVFEHVKGEEIPEPWKEKIHPNPDTSYEMTIILKEIAKPSKGKWAKVVERFEKESFLKGQSEEVVKQVREFRDNFSFKDTFIDND